MTETNKRKIILKKYSKMISLIDGYDGVEGFLGESFCEDKLGMERAVRSERWIDGHINKKSVQVKFKWVNENNWKSRYISINSNAIFDLLIVTYAKYGDSEVKLFGCWKKVLIDQELKRINSNRIFLTRLCKLKTFSLPSADSKPFPSAIHRNLCMDQLG